MDGEVDRFRNVVVRSDRTLHLHTCLDKRRLNGDGFMMLCKQRDLSVLVSPSSSHDEARGKYFNAEKHDSFVDAQLARRRALMGLATFVSCFPAR